MATPATAAQIHEEIQRRIRNSDTRDGDCRDCGAPTPRRSERNACGTHWAVDVLLLGVTLGCEPVVEEIVRGVMAEYELRD
jgi:hypothetical protein